MFLLKSLRVAHLVKGCGNAPWHFFFLLFFEKADNCASLFLFCCVDSGDADFYGCVAAVDADDEAARKASLLAFDPVSVMLGFGVAFRCCRLYGRSIQLVFF